MAIIPGFVGGVAGGAGISVIISAFDRFSAVFKRAQFQAAKTGKAFSNFAKVAAGVGIVAGVGLAVGLAKSIQLSTELEDAMVGVRKTTGLAGQELEKLRKTFVELSKNTATSAAEFGRIAIIAGQLGITGTKNLADFSQVVAEMATATVLSSDEAALGLARLGAIMNIPIERARNLASGFVALGNTVAADERAILDMSLRLAGAGKVIGLTEAEVLGFSATLAELGIRAESGGTAFGKLFIKISSAVSKGEKQLDLFAKTAGLTTDEFVKSFKDEAGEAIILFLQGLGKIRDEGGDVLKVMEEIGGLSEVRLRDAILRVTGDIGNLRTNMELSSKSVEEGVAVGEEHAQSLDSVSKQFEILKNRMKSVFITDNKRLKNLLTGINLQTEQKTLLKGLRKEMNDGNISVDEFNKLWAESTIAMSIAGGNINLIREEVERLRTALQGVKEDEEIASIAVFDKIVAIREEEIQIEKLRQKILEEGSATERLTLLSKEFLEKRNEIIAAGALEDAAEQKVLEQLRKLEEEYPEVARAIDLMTKALERATEEANQFNRAINPTTSISAGGGKRINIAVTSTGRAFVPGGPGKLKLEPGETLDDFILRPGQKPIQINPEDTVVGFKGDAPTGTTIDKVEIIIQGVGQNADSIAREIQERLSALGRPLVGI